MSVPSPGTPGGGTPGARTKDDYRRFLLGVRRARTPERRAEVAAALVGRLAEVLAGVPDPVCLFVPVGTEPGAVDTEGASTGFPDVALALGRHVLLPIVTGTSPLDWASYTGPDSLVAGPHGLREPSGERLGPTAIADAGLVLVPALAVDRLGVRLGRGAGHYDRSLALAGPRVRRVALVGDDELLDVLPAEDHDIRMHAVWRPGHGVTELPL